MAFDAQLAQMVERSLCMWERQNAWVSETQNVDKSWMALNTDTTAL